MSPIKTENGVNLLTQRVNYSGPFQQFYIKTLDEIDQKNEEIIRAAYSAYLRYLNTHLKIADLSGLVIEYLKEEDNDLESMTPIFQSVYLERMYSKDLTQLLEKYWCHLPPHYFFRLEIGSDFCLFSIKYRENPKGSSGFQLARWEIQEFLPGTISSRPIRDKKNFFLNYKAKKGISYLSLSKQRVYVISAIYPRGTDVKISAFRSLNSASKNEDPLQPVIEKKWAELRVFVP